MQDLGTLALDGSSAGLAINDHGDVVGAYYGNDYGHAFHYRNGIMQDIGTLGGSYGSAMDINNTGQIVGFSSTPAGGIYSHAFLYEGDQMFDLNSLYAGLLSDGTTAGFTRLDIARGINDSGVIVGGGRYFDGFNYFDDYGFILDTRVTPGGTVPEAGHTLGLLAGAFVGLAMWRRKGRGEVRSTVVALK
jgi:probable HAF family extracellular repeat protein